MKSTMKLTFVNFVALLFATDLVQFSAATALQTWCTSQGHRAAYVSQSCFVRTTDSKTFDQHSVGCTEQPNGGLAILPSTKIVESIASIFSDQPSSNWFFFAYRQASGQSGGLKDNWTWRDAQNNSYGSNVDIPWSGGEPNDFNNGAVSGVEEGYENCGAMKTDGTILDFVCANYLMGICQYREPGLVYLPYKFGYKVLTSSTTIIQDKSSLNQENSADNCAILCRTYLTCQGFAMKSSATTCTLLFTNRVPDSDVTPDSNWNIYGLL